MWNVYIQGQILHTAQERRAHLSIHRQRTSNIVTGQIAHAYHGQEGSLGVNRKFPEQREHLNVTCFYLAQSR